MGSFGLLFYGPYQVCAPYQLSLEGSRREPFWGEQALQASHSGFSWFGSSQYDPNTPCLLPAPPRRTGGTACWHAPSLAPPSLCLQPRQGTALRLWEAAQPAALPSLHHLACFCWLQGCPTSSSVVCTGAGSSIAGRCCLAAHHADQHPHPPHLPSLGCAPQQVALNQLCLAPITITVAFTWNLALTGQLDQLPGKPAICLSCRCGPVCALHSTEFVGNTLPLLRAGACPARWVQAPQLRRAVCHHRPPLFPPSPPPPTALPCVATQTPYFDCPSCSQQASCGATLCAP